MQALTHPAPSAAAPPVLTGRIGLPSSILSRLIKGLALFLLFYFWLELLNVYTDFKDKVSCLPSPDWGAQPWDSTSSGSVYPGLMRWPDA